MSGLTKKQCAVLQFIQEYISQNKHSPSFRDIQQHFGYSSLGTVYNHIKILKRKGVIFSEKQSSRSLKPVQEKTEKYLSVKKIPIVGKISSRLPLEMAKTFKYIKLPSSMISSEEKTYALKVFGDGFIDELIADGDTIIVEARQHAFAGETVIAVLNQQETVIKQIHYVDNYVRLEAITPHQQPIILRKGDFEIQGVVLSILRKL